VTVIVVLLTNVQHVIPTVTRKAATKKVLANVINTARAVTGARKITRA